MGPVNLWGTRTKLVLLRQVARENLPGVLSQELLEDGCEGDHGFAGAQLGALHHALLVIDKQVSTAGQHCPTLLRTRFGWTLCSEVGHEPVDQLAQVPAGAQEHTAMNARTGGPNKECTESNNVFGLKMNKLETKTDSVYFSPLSKENANTQYCSIK